MIDSNVKVDYNKDMEKVKTHSSSSKLRIARSVAKKLSPEIKLGASSTVKTYQKVTAFHAAAFPSSPKISSFASKFRNTLKS